MRQRRLDLETGHRAFLDADQVLRYRSAKHRDGHTGSFDQLIFPFSPWDACAFHSLRPTLLEDDALTTRFKAGWCARASDQSNGDNFFKHLRFALIHTAREKA